MSFALRCSNHSRRLLFSYPPRCPIRLIKTKSIQTDSRGIPIEPTWSVNELLSSYPKPVISSVTLRHIHELSALIPPEEGTPDHDKIQQELGDLVKLVEAVKLVNTDDVKFVGRNYKEDWDMDSRSNDDDQGVKEHGTSLLKHAARTMDGYYAVDADRQR